MSLLTSMATQKATKPKGKTAEKEVHPITDNGAIGRYIEVSEEIDNLTAEKKMLESGIKSEAKKVWLEVYQSDGRKPDSFKVEGENGKSLLYIVMDKYKTLTPEKIEAIKKWGMGNLLRKEKKLELNMDIVAQYEQQIFDALMGMDIPSEAKAKLLTYEEKDVVVKGAIEMFGQTKKLAIAFTHFEPIEALKK